MVKLRARDFRKKPEPEIVYVDRVVEKPGPVVTVPEPQIIETERVVEVAADMTNVETAVGELLAKAGQRKAYRFTILRDINNRMTEVVATPVEG